MPELPEIETIARALRSHVLGRKIIAQYVNPIYIRLPVQSLVQSTITQVYRRAKYLILEMDNGPSCAIFHLGMSGLLLVTACPVHPAKHDHVILTLDNGCAITLNDPRRFGRFLTTSAVTQFLQSCGPEPFAIGPEYLAKILSNKNSVIKAILMNGQLIAGIGNIYASEILFFARIHPCRAGQSLNMEETHNLLAGIQIILNKAIELGGSSIKDYRNITGDSGGYQKEFLIYGHKNCQRCDSPIIKIRQQNRSTYLCEQCQPLIP